MEQSTIIPSLTWTMDIFLMLIFLDLSRGDVETFHRFIWSDLEKKMFAMLTFSLIFIEDSSKIWPYLTDTIQSCMYYKGKVLLSVLYLLIG